jgi:transcriptional regulator with XRE-family HTH domain
MTRPAQPIRLPAIPGPKSSLAERVRWLIDDYWKGNRKKCAEDVGVNPTYISRICTETNNPGTDLLEKLADKPFINTRWLLSGNGTPYLSVDQQLPTSWMLPVLSELPIGPIRQTSFLLIRSQKEIDASNYSISRCWTQLTAADQLAYRGDLGFQVGDYILWETDPVYWKDMSIFQRRPTIIADKKTCQPKISILEYQEPEDDEPYLSCHDLVRPPVEKNNCAREYRVQVAKDSSLIVTEVTKRKRPEMPNHDLLYVREQRRIIAVALMRSGSY